MDQSHFYIIAISYFLGIASPGPSLIYVITNSLCIGKKQGILAALGIVVGIAIQVVVVFIFIDFIQSYNIKIFNILRYFCTGFLVYIGLNMLFSVKQEKTHTKTHGKNYFFKGLLTEILNPIAHTFFLSIFSLYSSVSNSLNTKVIYFFEFFIIGLIWYLGVAYLVSIARIHNFFNSYNNYIIKFAGLFFCASGIIMLISILYN